MTSNHLLKHIFLMPCGSAKAKNHLEKTILRPVEQAVIFPMIGQETQAELGRIFGTNAIAIWGSSAGRTNRAFFHKMEGGDYLLFITGKKIKVIAEIVLTTISPELSQVLWPNDEGRLFELIYFLDHVVTVDVPLTPLYNAMGYSLRFIAQGLTAVAEERLKTFYDVYGDPYELVADPKAELVRNDKAEKGQGRLQVRVKAQPYCLFCDYEGHKVEMKLVALDREGYPDLTLGLWKCPHCQIEAHIPTPPAYVEVLEK